MVVCLSVGSTENHFVESMDEEWHDIEAAIDLHKRLLALQVFGAGELRRGFTVCWHRWSVSSISVQESSGTSRNAEK